MHEDTAVPSLRLSSQAVLLKPGQCPGSGVRNHRGPGPRQFVLANLFKDTHSSGKGSGKELRNQTNRQKGL